jgi:hypothetical protein
MQASPECFSLSLIPLFSWVETVIVPRSYRFEGLGKFRPAYLDQLRAGHSPELFAQHFGQKPVLRREFHSESNSLRDRCGGLFCTGRYRLRNVGRRYIHEWPIRSHRRVRAHSSPLPPFRLSRGFSLASTKLAFGVPHSSVKSLKDNLSGLPFVESLPWRTAIGGLLTSENDHPRAKPPEQLQDSGKGDCSGCSCGCRLRTNAESSVMTSPIGKGLMNVNTALKNGFLYSSLYLLTC